MARALLVVQRYPGPGRLSPYLDVLNRNLCPDNIVPRPPVAACDGGAELAIFNPNGATELVGTSACIGTLLGQARRWHETGTPAPDGSYALLRCDAHRAELVADAAGSRTIWYVLTEETLIASTSQRAIVALLGSFELNRSVLPWMLSSGTLGPAGGWDARLEQVRPGERVVLDRERWKLSRDATPVRFDPDFSAGRDEHYERLVAAVKTACRDWTFDPSKWVLTLSGGTDSRCLLALLRDRPGLETVTWGQSGARDEEGTDARVARDVARKLGVTNRYFPIDLSAVAHDVVVNRFLTASEGRVARISAYLDGFSVWKTLFEEGRDGIIRGDEVFGSIVVRNAYGVRHTSSITLLTDYFQPETVASFELPEQTVPDDLSRRADESLATWRDRLYQQFRVPVLLAGLSDAKAAYVEIANPLLSRGVLECVRALPDDLRTEKLLWRDVVRSQLPSMPFANRIAIVSLEEFVTSPGVLELMLAELSGKDAAELFSPALLTRLSTSIKNAMCESRTPRRRREFRLPIALPVPARLRAAARSWLTPPTVAPLVLAFRSFLASRMNTLLKLDAATLPAGLQRAVNL